ncbi:MAG: response regulator [Sterolibacteriaceae bacterium MAG5]|nr:response regulator [Candidatus Nitricoxidireducens bremensis]
MKGSARKVLIVDDAAAVRGMLRALLVEEGYAVVGELATGARVLETVAGLAPEIVCLDRHLPDADGLELLRALHAAHPAVAVVMISGSEDADLETVAAEAGAAGFIRKPFSAERIVRELGQVAHAQALLQAARAPGGDFAVRRARARALVADDSATMRLLLTAILARAGVEVVAEASDGKQAVELAARHRPDIVCLDLDMPVMTGLQALPAIRSGCPGARVLMITGSASREAIAEAARGGARGYILKPFHPDRVVEAVDKLLA